MNDFTDKYILDNQINNEQQPEQETEQETNSDVVENIMKDVYNISNSNNLNDMNAVDSIIRDINTMSYNNELEKEEDYASSPQETQIVNEEIQEEPIVEETESSFWKVAPENHLSEGFEDLEPLNEAPQSNQTFTPSQEIENSLQTEHSTTIIESEAIVETTLNTIENSSNESTPSIIQEEKVIEESAVTNTTIKNSQVNQPENIEKTQTVETITMKKEAPSLNDTSFSDIYVISEDEVYIPDPRSETSLMNFTAPDIKEFYTGLKQGFKNGITSYSLNFKGTIYRVERTKGIYGEQFCARKMPSEIPPLAMLGFNTHLTTNLISLSNKTGLILVAGPTGSGKTTTCSALLKEYLNREGGFAYTIEDPAEMPLDGKYKSIKGGIGLCKQTEPQNEDWGSCLKSALRSKPRFILVGEIRTPETASEVLRAATSGHLVLSTVHANNIQDAINSVVKYASATELSEDLAYDLFSRGMQCVFHQTLSGAGVKKTDVSFLFANPDNSQGCAIRGNIKTGKLNLATAIETQAVRLARGISLFQEF